MTKEKRAELLAAIKNASNAAPGSVVLKSAMVWEHNLGEGRKVEDDKGIVVFYEVAAEVTDEMLDQLQNAKVDVVPDADCELAFDSPIDFVKEGSEIAWITSSIGGKAVAPKLKRKRPTIKHKGVVVRGSDRVGEFARSLKPSFKADIGVKVKWFNIDSDDGETVYGWSLTLLSVDVLDDADVTF